MQTPSVWMEARCGFFDLQRDRMSRRTECHETARDGCFARNITTAARHFRAQGWDVFQGEWRCPGCRRLMEE